jgi:hypothetical protein|tara:strand:- start:31032 stop:31151 length:120 start_codon:yes stop_codon:yes gene_type:complete
MDEMNPNAPEGTEGETPSVNPTAAPETEGTEGDATEATE